MNLDPQTIQILVIAGIVVALFAAYLWLFGNRSDNEAGEREFGYGPQNPYTPPPPMQVNMQNACSCNGGTLPCPPQPTAGCVLARVTPECEEWVGVKVRCNDDVLKLQLQQFADAYYHAEQQRKHDDMQRRAQQIFSGPNPYQATNPNQQG